MGLVVVVVVVMVLGTLLILGVCLLLVFGVCALLVFDVLMKLPSCIFSVGDVLRFRSGSNRLRRLPRLMKRSSRFGVKQIFRVCVLLMIGVMV